MKFTPRFALVFVVALAFVPFLPLYIERTMTHVMFAHGGGGAIEWGWKRCALSTFWANYRYLRPEQDPRFWLTVNIALALTYCLAIALLVALLLGPKRRSVRREAKVTPPNT